ncbi:PDZ/DHR/GLGF domain protein [Teladorsagia circumcincta]|uniref:PDZ/DHR/GLGF domain protein n=1 Tax=Teladorsagia circumcincta TaxID=45464 RepID=A0A2G9U5S6_TELCI|nr:PDZ/DHR/GLGF domain protein [Teladorsagia circumcincta]
MRRQSLHNERPMSGIAATTSGEYDITLTRNDTDGFGFIIISSLNRNGSTIGQILENSPAEKCGRLKVGDRVVAVNGIDILNLTHGEIVNLIKASGLTVRLTIAAPMPDGSPLASNGMRRQSLHNERPMSGIAATTSGEYDVTLTRNDTDGFGFIIISSLNRNGSTIGQILENSPAEKCGRLKVGDRVVAVNGIDILNLTHGEIVNLIKASGLTVRLTIAAPMPDGSPLASKLELFVVSSACDDVIDAVLLHERLSDKNFIELLFLP